MILTTLQLEEFRSYRRLSVDLPAAGLRIFGQNAGGKTSLLEAVYLLATMRSPRASSERETIHWESGVELGLPPYARVAARIRHNRHETDVEVVLTVDEERGGALRKRVKLDGRPRRAIDAVGALKVVLFTPDDLNLILGSPSVRRRYLDITLSQIDSTYLQALGQYGRLLEQRNSLLKELGGRRPRDERAIEDQMAYWDAEIVTRGAYLLAQRLRYVHEVDRVAAEEFRALARTEDRLGLRYSTTVTLPDALRERVVESTLADAQAFVARALESDLHRLRPDELRRGVTLVGPHRDDLHFLLGGHELSAYGSRGQQRLAVVATKLAELRQVVASTGERPVLLLDDVLSELDPEHQERLLAVLGSAGCQILITATDRALLDQPALAALPLVEARNGTLVWVEGEEASQPSEHG
ncbi:DNA replication/repair protein RecF [Sphaerobacter thermophilus]|uniref:DNA replication and repair protein RecF n=2 Tax=Sphaerobacter TaxID=2056 RepID=D1C3C8_SPHTD|nr:DNA replication and repair protein RecF [Sphaerobacter thermophilus]ACZ38745.1 DNA replication and repair protein RecF [Sphaerobacter thermophilus DSM 20745]